MKIAVIGTGYVGLVTGTCLAEFGNNVTCLDIDEAKIKRLRKGESPIYEPDLDTYLARNIELKRLSFTTDRKQAVTDADLVFLALPTPPAEDGSPDLRYITNEVRELAPLLKPGAVVVNKSTVPAGTAAQVEAIIAEHTKAPFDVVSNPEFLREGVAVHDFFYPDRVVIGAGSERARKVMDELYRPLSRNSVPILFMDRVSAELAKYASNSFLAIKISFMNEMANLCEDLGADIDMVRQAVGSDTRIGPKFLYPGIGYGGSCFPKDLLGLAKTAEQKGHDMAIIQAAIAANRVQQQVLAEKVAAYFGSEVKGKHFAIWGLAFKPNTDDIREAPARVTIERLLNMGASVTGFDPEAGANMRAVFAGNEGFKTVDDQYEALGGADALLIATEWQQFYAPDLARVKKELKQPLIFDGRNVLTEDEINRVGGIRYESIGRRVIEA